MGVKETKQATQNLYRLVENLHTRLSAARSYQNADLTAEALASERASRSERSRSSARYKAASLLKTARDGLAFAQSQLDEHRPKIDTADVAQLTRAQQAWDMVVKPMRDEGKTWFQIAAIADEDVMFALQRFGEQRIKIEEGPDAPAIINNLHGAIDRRLAETHPDSEVRQLFQDAAVAADHMQLAEHLASGADAQLPTQVVGTIVGAKSAAYHLGVELPHDPRPTAEQLDLLVRSQNPVAVATVVE